MTLDDFGKTVAGVLLGWLAAVVAFRTRFAIAEMRITQLETERTEQKEHNKNVERIQRVTLEIVSAIARKQGITHRAFSSDVLAESLEETGV